MAWRYLVLQYLGRRLLFCRTHILISLQRFYLGLLLISNPRPGNSCLVFFVCVPLILGVVLKGSRCLHRGCRCLTIFSRLRTGSRLVNLLNYRLSLRYVFGGVADVKTGISRSSSLKVSHAVTPLLFFSNRVSIF